MRNSTMITKQQQRQQKSKKMKLTNLIQSSRFCSQICPQHSIIQGNIFVEKSDFHFTEQDQLRYTELKFFLAKRRLVGTIHKGKG